MWYIAFNLGLLGSLHCLGMCGALSCSMCHKPKVSKLKAAINALQYQIGRTITYISLGLLLCTLGEVMLISHLQKWVSILIGIMMILIFVFSIDLESKISQSSFLAGMYWSVKSKIALAYQHSNKYPTFMLGVLNGLLPCGLVYLALAGALASGGVIEGGTFMMFFGMGTIPLMFLSTIGVQFLSNRLRIGYMKFLPYISLCFGIYLICRGIMIGMPVEFDFWYAIKHPIMCFSK